MKKNKILIALLAALSGSTLHTTVSSTNSSTLSLQVKIIKEDLTRLINSIDQNDKANDQEEKEKLQEALLEYLNVNSDRRQIFTEILASKSTGSKSPATRVKLLNDAYAKYLPNTAESEILLTKMASEAEAAKWKIIEKDLVQTSISDKAFKNAKNLFQASEQAQLDKASHIKDKATRIKQENAIREHYVKIIDGLLKDNPSNNNLKSLRAQTEHLGKSWIQKTTDSIKNIFKRRTNTQLKLNIKSTDYHSTSSPVTIDLNSAEQHFLITNTHPDTVLVDSRTQNSSDNSLLNRIKTKIITTVRRITTTNGTVKDSDAYAAGTNDTDDSGNRRNRTHGSISYENQTYDPTTSGYDR